MAQELVPIDINVLSFNLFDFVFASLIRGGSTTSQVQGVQMALFYCPKMHSNME